MIACSLSPDSEGIIAMDFNSPQEVRDFIVKKKLSIGHWVLYGMLADQLEALFEEKDDYVLQDRWNDYLEEHRERHHVRFDDMR